MAMARVVSARLKRQSVAFSLLPSPPSFEENDLSRNSDWKGVSGEFIRQLTDQLAASRSDRDRFRRLHMTTTRSKEFSFPA
jgi:hypothetical protein